MQPVVLGRIGAPHGVRGRVRVQSYTRPPESILEFPQWWLDAGEGWRPWTHHGAEVRSNGIVIALEGCTSRESAVALRHATIAVPRSELPPPEPGEYYWFDLIGLAVETTEGVPLGQVDHLFETGANDVLVVRGERERLIPWVQGRFVQSVDTVAGRIVVDWDPEF